ncbi:MAG: glycosyltransferase, partial [Gramella sp.]|nr:glycosyltransferase [Christiangramia sp.]
EVPDIFPYLASANLGVLSSRSEGLPLALLEYGLSELPVVCTDVGDCREVTAQFAKLVPAQKPEMLAKAIIAYIQDEKNRILDASNLKKRVEELYSEKVVISQYLKFIEEI